MHIQVEREYFVQPLRQDAQKRETWKYEVNIIELPSCSHTVRHLSRACDCAVDMTTWRGYTLSQLYLQQEQIHPPKKQGQRGFFWTYQD